MEDFELELKVSFLDEAAQSIADVEQCFLSLETDAMNSENLNKIFRLAHNLKGGSRAVGFEDMGVFTHAFESFILRVKNGELEASGLVVSLLLRANDHLRTMIESYKSNINAKIDSTELLHAMENFSSQAAPEQTSEPVPNEPTSEPVLESASSESISESESAPVLEMAPEPEPAPAVHAVEKVAPPTAAPEKPLKAAQSEESIRVALSKVERLIDYIGEMVVLQNVLKEQIQEISSPLVRKSFSQLGKVGKEIQDIAMSLRMVPIKPTFHKMQRIVRDTAVALGKDVSILLVGENTELDKTVLEMINDPLVHLVRNSVDHGIESAEKRIAAGKSARGQVTLAAFHHAGKLVLEVKDDGGGLDPEKLKNIAIAKGVIKAGTPLTENECFKLIFAPGFSTKEVVTDISGRGVGMDVVKTNISDLGGEIQVESVLGAGSTFRITLPLTLAIIDAMIMTYNGQRFVLPLTHVHETLQVKPEMIKQKTIAGDILLLRGENIPLCPLGDFFGIRSAVPFEQMTILVIRSTPHPFALMVDAVLGQQQVVIKQLSRELRELKGASGITILGDGRPSLILEPMELIKRKQTKSPPMAGVAI